jgi:MinD superfamily P-loop ATPase
MRLMKLKYGVVINRASSLDHSVADFCRDRRIPVLLEIPDERKAAEAYSQGQLLVKTIPGFRELFEHLYNRILSEIQSTETPLPANTG